jgi:sphinganine-1-phosphate aldolase
VPLSFPEHGLPPERVFAEMEAAREADVDWRGGRLGIYVHYAGDDVLAVAQEAHRRFFSENALGSSAFPSLRRFETDIVAWTRSLLGSEEAAGTVTGGGTESIFLAMKTARDWARDHRPGAEPPVVVAPLSAHPAFDKAAHYLGLRSERVPIGRDYRADPAAMARAIDRNVIALVGSAPAFPHGVIDPIPALAELAERHGLWLHVDACVGGFIAPFARRLGYPVPAFDFSVPGVTSMSADLHKYGFTAKGTSVVLLRDPGLLEYQVFEFDAWPRGHYRSTTFTGTRPGGPIAAAWAVMRYLGVDGYERLARTIMGTRDRLIEGVRAIDGLAVVGEPDLAVLAVAADGLDVDALAEAMAERGWFMTRTEQPPGIHLGMITPAHAPVAARYLDDLAEATAEVRRGRRATRTGTPTYGG